MSAGAGPQMSNYPYGFANGITVQGMPILNAYGGQVFWVHSVSGADGNDGTFQRPLATLDRAFSLVSAGRGDIVMIKPGHVETISTATAMALDVAGVAVVGLGVGASRPTFTLDTIATATFGVSAANIVVANCLVKANFADVAAAFTLANAPGFALLGVECRDTSNVLNFLSVVDTNATSNNADDLSLIGCKRVGAGATAATCVVKMDGTNARLTIRDGYFTHAATTTAGLMPIATGKVITDAIIDNNTIILTGSAGASTGIIITTDGTTNSGMISRNRIQSLDATTEILVTASSGFMFSENYYSGAADKSGYLLPAADA
jgi:hypothetical protein